jgi:DNA invertase Pin-like site-specific DNA recombinase
VLRSIIEHHPSGPSERLTQGIKTGDDHRTIHAAFKDKRVQAPLGMEKTQHVDPSAFGQRHFDPLADGVPGIRHTRGERKTAVIYARVSTDEQTPDNQLKELRAVASRMQWQLVKEYVDHGVSGAKGRERRPAYDQLCTAITRWEFNLVMVWSVDRLGRSLSQLVGLLSELQSKGVDLYLHQQGIDTTTPAGKAMFQMCGVFAEFERAMIQERVKAGLARARAQGTPLGRPRVSVQVTQAVLAARGQGKGIKRIARELDIGVGTVQRIIKEDAGRIGD